MEWGELWGELWGGKVAAIEDHNAQAKARLRFQFRDLPDLGELTSLLVARTQTLENFLSDLEGLHAIDTAYGFLLDTIGVILGLPRLGFGDEAYRVRLRATASVLLPNRRTVGGLLRMLRILLNDPTTTVLDSDIFFEPDFADLVDPETNVQGVVDGTTYNSAVDGRNFNGSTDRIDWLGMPDLATTGWTLSAKVTPASLGTVQRIFSAQSASSAEALTISITATGAIRVEHQTSGVTLVRESTATLNAGLPTIVTVSSIGTNDVAGVSIFLSSFETSYAVSTSGTGTRDSTAFSWSLGGREQDDTVNFNGVISDVTSWGKRLTPAEVTLHVDGGQRNITYTEVYPKGFVIAIKDLTVDEAIGFAPFIAKAKPATYNVTFIAAPTGFFGYGDGSGTIVTSTLSFGDGSGTINVGGPYAAIVPV